MTEFRRFALRTTDAVAARAFYREVLGHDRSSVWPLHEQALARGARPHWLGHLGVPDVERTVAAFIERGAARLGPTVPTGDGGEAVVLRDPGGAVVAVSTPPQADDVARDVVFHVLNTSDVARAAATYREIFGWEFAERIAMGELELHPFAWRVGGLGVGALADIADRPGVHPHWLFFFEVNDLASAMAATRALGGDALPAVEPHDGAPHCVCDDPQGAAFGLRERRRRREV